MRCAPISGTAATISHHAGLLQAARGRMKFVSYPFQGSKGLVLGGGFFLSEIGVHVASLFFLPFAGIAKACEKFATVRKGV